jgi:hypothetical protein
MNKIYLDKLCEFTHTTWKNYGQFNLRDKDFNIEQQISIIKQNISLNEKGVSNKYNYIELSNIIPEIESDQLVLLLPIVWNINKNHEWYYLLNSLLIVLNDDYMFNSSLLKKKTIETFDKTFRKKIVIDDLITEDIIEKIAKLTNITLIILTSKSKHIYNNKNSSDKVVVLYKTDNVNYEYYPVINWTDKFFNKNDLFVKYLIDFKFKADKKDDDDNNSVNSEDIVKEKSKKNKSTKKKTNITIDEDKNTISKIKNNTDKSDDSDKSKKIEKSNDNDFYEEVFTEANNAIFISEAVDNKESIVSSTSKKNDDTKKTKSKKNTKDIFVPNNNNDKKSVKEEKDNDKNKNNDKDKNVVVEDDSVFKKTEKINKKDLDLIKETVKITSSLGDLQKIALKLSIGIIQGATKSGKPKRKTKQELYDEIQEFIENFGKK